MRSSTGMQSLYVDPAYVAEVTEILFASSDLVTVASLDESINTHATHSESGSTVHDRSEEGAGRSSTQHMEGGSSEPMSGEDQDDDPSHDDEPSAALHAGASRTHALCAHAGSIT